MFNNCDDLLRVDDVIKTLKLGRSTVYQMLSNGQIKGFKLGNQWRIPREALEELIINSNLKVTIT